MASISVKRIQSLARQFAFLPAALLFANALQAQQPDTAFVHKVLLKYAKENAVITNSSHRLIIDFEEGQLTARSSIHTERVLLGNLSSTNDNKDAIYDGYTSEVTHLDAIAYIPKKGGGYEEKHKYNVFSSGAGEGISDDRVLYTAFTGLTPGSVIRLTANQEHQDLAFLPRFFVSEYYPVMHAEFEVVVPKFVDMKFVIKGENKSLIKQTREDKNGNYIYRFTADNVPANKHFSNVPSSLYYLPHVVCYISSFRLPGVAKDSIFLSDPEHLYKNKIRFIRNLNTKQDTSLQKLAAKITKGDVTPRQKAEHIYNWVQNNIHYIGFEVGLGGWVPREADTVCKKMYGDCKDMSSLIMQLGHMAGLETHLAWIGTTSNPYRFEETPVPFVSNHMICAVKLDGDWVFMDGTHSNLPFGANRDDIQGKQAMISIDQTHYQIVDIPVTPAAWNTKTDSSFIHISDKYDHDLEGRFKQKRTGHEAWNLALHLSYYTKDKNEREKEVRRLAMRGSNKFILDNYDLNIGETGNKEISLTGNFNVEGYVNKIGKQYIINMNLLHTKEDNHIDTTDRKVGFYHEFKSLEKEVVVLEIPKGCKVTYLPKPAKGSAEGLWSYNISYAVKDNKIILTKEYQLNTMVVTPDQFAANNKLVDELEKQYKESVVLTAK